MYVGGECGIVQGWVREEEKKGSEILNGEKKKINPQPPWRWVSYKREKSGLNEGVFQAALDIFLIYLSVTMLNYYISYHFVVVLAY